MAWEAAQKSPDILYPPFFGEGVAADGRRWEFNIKNEVLVTNKIPVDVVFIGDSITQVWELNAYFRQFGLVVNRGIGGDVAEIVARRFEGDAVQLKPRACVVMVGINNTWCLDSVIRPWCAYSPDQLTDPEDVFQLVTDSYRKILELAREHHLPLLFCSVLPVLDRSREGQNRNRLVLRLNQALKDLCAFYGAVYVDYHSALVDQDGLTMREGLTDDILHPHVIGYNRMAAILTPLLQKVLDTENSLNRKDAKI